MVEDGSVQSFPSERQDTVVVSTQRATQVGTSEEAILDCECGVDVRFYCDQHFFALTVSPHLRLKTATAYFVMGRAINGFTHGLYFSRFRQ